MQITPGSSPLTLAMLKALGGQSAGGNTVTAALAPSGSTDPAGGNPARNEPAGPPEPGRIIPRGSFVDLKA